MTNKGKIYYADITLSPLEGAGVETIGGYSNDLPRLTAWVQRKATERYEEITRYYPHDMSAIRVEEWH